jgi:molybdopterin synthase catalytic subunit
MATIRVQHEPIDVGAEFAALMAAPDGTTRTDIGGIGSFIGTVRGTAKGRPITEMALEHYPGMTERALAAIADEAASRWQLLAATIVHRVGPMAPGETIVLVLAASAHRQDALDATAFLIDWLKTKAPFWKKETFADGTHGWVDARESDEAAAARWGTGK